MSYLPPSWGLMGWRGLPTAIFRIWWLPQNEVKSESQTTSFNWKLISEDHEGMHIGFLPTSESLWSELTESLIKRCLGCLELSMRSKLGTRAKSHLELFADDYYWQGDLSDIVEGHERTSPNEESIEFEAQKAETGVEGARVCACICMSVALIGSVLRAEITSCRAERAHVKNPFYLRVVGHVQNRQRCRGCRPTSLPADQTLV